MSFNRKYSYYNPNTNWDNVASNAAQQSQQPQYNAYNYNTQSSNVSSFQPNSSLILPSNSPSIESARREVIQGCVTHIYSTFGYINDTIMFSKSDVSGEMVEAGDTVVVEVSYQPNNAIKYKGERVIRVDDSNKSVAKPVLNENRNKMHTLKDDVLQKRDSSNDFMTRQSFFGSKEDKISHQSPIKRKPKETILTNPKIHSKSINQQSKFSMPIKFVTEHRPIRSESQKRVRSSTKIDDILEKRIGSHEKHSGTYEKRGGSFEKHGGSHGKRGGSHDKRNGPRDTRDKSHENERKRKDKTKSPERSETRKSKSRESSETRKSKTRELEKMDDILITAIVKSNKPQKTEYVSFAGDNFALRELDTYSLRYKYKGFQLPPQFFHVSLKYQQNFPLNHPIKLGNKCHFKILDKKVQCLDKDLENLLNKPIDPPDADSTFTAKVILLTMDELSEFYKQTINIADESEEVNKIPVTKAIRFLVASRGEYNEFAVGGRWSPSLDGENPEEDPQVLINTAIRTTKSMIGIDLSGCLWSKFLEFHYYRPMAKVEKNKDSNISESKLNDLENLEPRMETVVYYIPDVWNRFPSTENWINTAKLYQNELTNILCPPPPVPIKPIPKSKTNDDIDEEDYDENETNTPNEQTVEEQPTHYSLLNVETLKVAQLKKELELRKMNYRGVMVQLRARLRSALEKEENEEKNKDSKSEVPVVKIDLTKATCKLSEFEKARLLKVYKLPDTPHILLHPNRLLIDENIKFKDMSLHSLLSYNSEKLEEETFELAVFGKQFHQMLRRDAIFNLYKNIVMADSKDLIEDDEPPSKKKKLDLSKKTVNKHLLFSCVVIDRDKSNNIPIEDMRIMFENLGICLSTNQLDMIFAKFKNQKVFNYRNLTDKEMTDEEISKLMSLDLAEDVDYVTELSMGNKALFDSELPAEINNSNADMDRLKNQLDKSERLRQSLEMKTVEIREEAERYLSKMKLMEKELEKFRSASHEYRNRYHSENDRKEHYKKINDIAISDMHNIKKKILGALDFTRKAIDKQLSNDKKQSEKARSRSRSKVKSNSMKKNVEKKKDNEILDDIPDGGCNVIVLEDAADIEKTDDLYEDLENDIIIGDELEQNDNSVVLNDVQNKKDENEPINQDESMTDNLDDIELILDSDQNNTINISSDQNESLEEEVDQNESVEDEVETINESELESIDENATINSNSDNTDKKPQHQNEQNEQTVLDKSNSNNKNINNLMESSNNNNDDPDDVELDFDEDDSFEEMSSVPSVTENVIKE